MSIPSFGDLASYEPRWLGVKELNIGDSWRARWIEGTALPADVPVLYAYATVLFQDKGYVSRPRGSTSWDTLEGPLDAGEKAEAFVRRAGRERFGADAARIELVGFLECKATAHNADFPAGALTVRPIYTLSAKKVADGPRGAGYERRRLPMNEYMAAIRARYPELAQYLGAAIERHLVLRAKGEVA